MNKQDSRPWMVSLHGGHSGAYCDHAENTLREVVEAAVEAGYQTFGLSEHMPRTEERWLYPAEHEMGWDLETLHRLFAEYAEESRKLQEEFSDRIELLRGFELEVVPHDYPERVEELRNRHGFDFVVGSVHFLNGTIIDYSPDLFEEVADSFGGIEPLSVHYYEMVAEMVEAVSPEVVGHLDLVRKYAPDEESVDTPVIRRAALRALDAIKRRRCILDLNTAGLRKGLGRPYVAPWLVEEAVARDIPFCFGDDSHGVGTVGMGIESGRAYLLEHGVEHITTLQRENGRVMRRVVSLR